jgi:hypothetical protein
VSALVAKPRELRLGFGDLLFECALLHKQVKSVAERRFRHA